MDSKELKIQARLLGLVSFCVLMQKHDGIMGKAPRYVIEKQMSIDNPLEMFSCLDNDNQCAVKLWFETWKGHGIDFEFENLIEQMKKDRFDLPINQYYEKYGIRKG